MAEPISISKAMDKDGEYVMRKEAEASKADSQGKIHEDRLTECREVAAEARRESGLRLIEVHAKRSRQASASVKLATDALSGTWRAWLDSIGMPEATARARMRDAGFTEEERVKHKTKNTARLRDERAAKKATVDRPARKWIAALTHYAGVTKQLGGTDKLRIQKAMGRAVPESFKTEDEAQGFAQEYASHFPNDCSRELLKDSDERKLQRAITVEFGKLKAGFWEAARIDTLKYIEEHKFVEKREEAEAMKARYYALIEPLRTVLSMDDYRFILNCLHPDRAPEDRKEKFSRAFDIFRKLEKHIK